MSLVVGQSLSMKVSITLILLIEISNHNYHISGSSCQRPLKNELV